MVITDHNSVLYPDQFICEGICLAEALTLSDSASTTAANIVDLPTETLSLADSVSTTAAHIVVLPAETLSLTEIGFLLEV